MGAGGWLELLLFCALVQQLKRQLDRCQAGGWVRGRAALRASLGKPVPAFSHRLLFLPRFRASENAQLEEMLSHADAAAQGGSGEISRLEDELARAQVGASKDCSRFSS